MDYVQDEGTRRAINLSGWLTAYRDSMTKAHSPQVRMEPGNTAAGFFHGTPSPETEALATSARWLGREPRQGDRPLHVGVLALADQGNCEAAQLATARRTLRLRHETRAWLRLRLAARPVGRGSPREPESRYRIKKPASAKHKAHLPRL